MVGVMDKLSTELHYKGLDLDVNMRIVTLAYLLTSTDKQLGQANHLVNVWRDMDETSLEEYKPEELRNQFISEVPVMVQNHLDY